MADLQRKTANLFDTTWEQNGIDNIGNPVISSKRVRAYVDVEPNTEYTFSSSEYIRLIYGYSGTTKIGVIYDVSFNATKSYTFTTGATVNRLGIVLMNSRSSRDATDIVPTDVQDSMLNTGSTALPYEPCWQHSLRKLGYTSWQDAYVKEKSENVTPFASAQTIVNNGVTFVSDGMGQYTVNGTATADASADFDIPEFTIPVSVGAGGQGTFSLFNDNFGDNDGNVIEFYNNTTLIDVWSLHLDNRTSTTYVGMGGKKCNRMRIVVKSGVGVDHKTVKPMFTNNSTLPSAYEPYWK